jgi:hypothetical protein
MGASVRGGLTWVHKKPDHLLLITQSRGIIPNHRDGRKKTLCSCRGRRSQVRFFRRFFWLRCSLN